MPSQAPSARFLRPASVAPSSSAASPAGSLARRGLLWLTLLSLCALLWGCSKPQPPTITPKRGTITSVGPDGVGLRLEFDAYNPNGFALNVRSVKAKATFDSSIKLNEVSSVTAISLPSKATSPMSVDVKVPWNSLPQLMGLAASKTQIPYTVEGSVSVGGESLNVDVPFSMSGSVTRKELVGASLNSLPAIPGLPGLVP